jgi:hypothetical protein
MPRSALCYLLTDRTARFVWAGPGFRRLADAIDLSRLPTWPTRAAADRAADALRAAINLEATPAVVRLA